jgi:hypothetical protein
MFQSTQQVVDFRPFGWFKRERMPKASAPKSRKRSVNAVLDQAIQQLLSTTKAEAKKKGKPIERGPLRKEGYRERFIEKVERA